MNDPLGLSIGTVNLVAACNGNPPVSRRAVLTLYPHCAPKLDAAETESTLNEPGVRIGGFVERIGDSVALVSSDGSTHDPELLLVEALDAVMLAAGADAASSEIAIAVPAHWNPAAVQALRNGLRTHAGFVRSGMAPRLVSDTVAALTAANSELCLAATGVVGVLDFGGTGTSATLVDLAGDHEPVTPTMRYAAFSGDEIDQALLLRVFEELGHGSDLDPATTAAVGQLGQLREQCRAAKERLSTEAVTEVSAELGGRRCSMRLTREELGDLIQDRLTGLIYAVDDMLVRHNRSWADLSAVVTVGGGAAIPLVNERLSVHSRRPVVSPSQPGCAAACGALLLAAPSEPGDLRTRTSVGLLTTAATGDVIELPAGDLLVIDHEATTDRELAWSQTEYPGDVRAPYPPESYDEDGPAGWSMRLNAIDPPRGRRWRRIRLSQAIIGMCAVVAIVAIGGVAVTLTGIENRPSPPAPSLVPLPVPPPSLVPTPVPAPPAPPVPSAEPPPPPPVPSAEPPPPPPVPSAEPPPPPPPPPPVVVTTQPPPVATKRRPPPPSQTPTVTPTTTPDPPSPTTTEPPPTTSTVPMTTEWIRLPLIPVPIPVPVPQNQVPQNPAPQYPAPQYPGTGPNPFLSPGY
ncbi:MAG: Hsp70 family protein [Mycobacterium sp.]|nr:Hsp70 family protein [Mycobacterium sp.]